MLPIRYRSLNPLLDDLIHDLCNPSHYSPGVKYPVHDIIENDKEYVIEALLAGVKKEDVSIEIENDTMTIKAERKETKNLNYNRKETYFGKYERMFKLPEGIDRENIQSSMENGVLKIVVPKLVDGTKLSKKKIEIK
jgi:HSP20 family protein